MKGISFSVSDEIRVFADFYADMHGTTTAAMAKRGMIAEMRRHPLNQAQLDEFTRLHGKPPMACVPVRPVRAGGNVEPDEVSA